MLGRFVGRRQADPSARSFTDVHTLPFAVELDSGLIRDDDATDALLENCRSSLSAVLELLRAALQAATVVVVFPGPGSDELSLYAYSSSSGELRLGPFHSGSGVFGVLKGQPHLQLCPLRDSSPNRPYQRNALPGSFYGCRLHQASGRMTDGVSNGILCVDRDSSDPWSGADIALIGHAVEQINCLLRLSRTQLLVEYERAVLQNSLAGIRYLNTALIMEDVFSAAHRAIALLVGCDLLAIGLLAGDDFEIRYVSDAQLVEQVGRQFPLSDSWVAQAIKYRRSFPEDGTAEGRQKSLLQGLRGFEGCRSVLVVPLSREEGAVIGVLMIGTRAAGQLTRQHGDLLDMAAGQIATKIELARAHEQINRLATTDPLTGIANRRAFERAFQAMLDRARRRSGSFSLIICDIDHFKQVNDRFGHPFGDLVIQQVARQLAAVVRTGDLAARTGGEEFAVLLEDTDAAGGREVAERLRCNIRDLELWPDGQTDPVRITICAGISAFPADAEEIEPLLAGADQALYAAKLGGRDRVQLWSQRPL